MREEHRSDRFIRLDFSSSVTVDVREDFAGNIRLQARNRSPDRLFIARLAEAGSSPIVGVESEINASFSDTASCLIYREARSFDVLTRLSLDVSHAASNLFSDLPVGPHYSGPSGREQAPTPGADSADGLERLGALSLRIFRSDSSR